jgi:hypothetical protein
MKKNKIRLEISRVEPSKTSTHGYVLTLAEESTKKSKRRILRIIIGAFEAQSIVIAIENLKTSRPLTHELFKNFALALNVNISEIIINKFIEGVFYSLIIFNDGVNNYEIDSRTSDAIALALRFNAQIYTYEEILEAAGEPEEILEIDNNESNEKQVEDNEENLYKSISVEQLQKMLDEAVENENYELASKLRDEINKRK